MLHCGTNVPTSGARLAAAPGAEMAKSAVTEQEASIAAIGAARADAAAKNGTLAGVDGAMPAAEAIVCVCKLS